MNNKKFLTINILTAFVLMWAAESHAVGLGFSFGSGSENWDDDTLHEGDRKVSNVGFMVDTAVARKKVFNYRFTFMREDNEADTGHQRELDMDGYAMTHDFGLAVVQNRVVRFWMGPQLKASLYEDLTVNDTDVSGDVVGFGIGPVMGLNVHLPKVATFTFTAAYHIISAYAGDYSFNSFSDTDVDPDSTGLYLNFGIVFRINE